jgi:hypothetical protein
MFIPSCPEDSVLRRHFEAAVEMKRRMWLQMPPSDSILRRHATSLQSHSRTPRGAAQTPARASSHTPASTASAAPEKRGLIAWLRGLFT